MTHKPLIGLVPLVDTERDSYWMLPGYMKGIEEAGGIPVVLPLTTDEGDIRQLMHTVDGILFTGGHDVSPTLYHADRTEQCGETSAERDAMEQLLLWQVIDQTVPALGICRGIQFINAALGGTLYQDLPTETHSPLEHHMAPPYDRAIHTVDIMHGTPLHDLLGKDILGVNSYHHQAIKDLAPALKAMACAHDGITEAVYLPTHPFLWAVQWHPEFSYTTDPDSRKIFAKFVSECAAQGREK